MVTDGGIASSPGLIATAALAQVTAEEEDQLIVAEVPVACMILAALIAFPPFTPQSFVWLEPTVGTVDPPTNRLSKISSSPLRGLRVTLGVLLEVE
jgi:hypothetical protein